MAYDKHIWTCGEAITTEKLNHMEDGIAEGGEVSLEDLEALLPTETASGEIVTITDGQSIVPVKSLKVALEPIQDLHGYDKPWVGGAGANKWDEELVLGSIDGTTGADSSSARYLRSSFIDVLPNTTYCFTRTNNITMWIYAYDVNGDFIRDAFTSAGYATISSGIRTKEMPSGVYKIKFVIDSNEYGTTYNNDIAINYPSSVTTYSPYSNICPISGRTEVKTVVSPTTSATDGDTYTTALGRTVYGGTLDVISGELTVDRASVDLGTLNYSLSTERYPRFYTASLPNIKAPKTVIDLLNGICEAFDIKTAYETYTGVIGLAANENGELRIYAPTYSDATAFKTAMSGVQLVYELATPQTYQLTPQQIDLLLGTNNVWSDGEVTMIYNADVQLWVEKKLS